jgi:hypothetical protein
MESGLKVTAEVSTLLAKLGVNRGIHSANYTKALAKYFDECTEELSKRLKNIGSYDPRRLLEFDIDCPVHYLDEYDKAIGMLELSKTELIEITEQQYTNYVLDKWSWSGMYTRNTMSKLL